MSAFDDMRKATIDNINTQLISQLTKLNVNTADVDAATSLNLSLNALVNNILSDSADATIAKLMTRKSGE